MALTVTSVATGLNTGSGTTSGATVTATVANNDWLVVIQALAYDRVVTVSDSAGNVYTQRGAADTAPSGTINAHLRIFTAPVTSNITNGTVTASYTAAAGAMQVYRVRPSSGTITFVAADATGVSGAATNHAAATVSVANGNIIFGAAAIETNDSITGDSDTLNGSWSTVATVLDDGGTDTSSQSLVTQYKVVTGTGNQSWACATTSSRHSARSYLVLHGPAAALSIAAALGQYSLSGKTATLRKSMAPLAAGVGTYALTGTASTPKHSWLVAAAAGGYALTGTAASLNLGGRLDATTAGSYALTGTDALPFKTAIGGKTLPAGVGTYALTGTAALSLHGWVIQAGGTGATNLDLWSQGLDDPSWTKDNLTVTANATTAPDGTATADKLVETVANSQRGLQGRGRTLTNTAYTHSIYAKNGGTNFVEVGLASDNSYTKYYLVSYNLTTGGIGTVRSATYTGSSTIVDAGSGWWRIAVTITAADANSTGLSHVAISATDTFSAAYVGNVANGVYGWGSQLETGSSATAYIPTTTVPVTATLAGSYVLSGTTASTLRGFRVSAGDDVGAPLLDEFGNPLLDEFGNPILSDGITGGSYALTGFSVSLNATGGNKTLAVDPGSYALTGTNATPLVGFAVVATAGNYAMVGTAATLQASTPAAPPIRAMGEPPIARERRRRNEAERARALEQQRKARDRLKRAIGRLLEGLPPEFDEPEQLAEAEDNAIQAFNLLRAMRAPAPELDAASELISTIQAMRIAQPIVQLELARAYNHSHRHLLQKAQEDVAMTLLLGE